MRKDFKFLQELTKFEVLSFLIKKDKASNFCINVSSG